MVKEAYGQRSADLLKGQLGMAVDYRRYPMPHSAIPVRRRGGQRWGERVQDGLGRGGADARVTVLSARCQLSAGWIDALKAVCGVSMRVRRRNCGTSATGSPRGCRPSDGREESRWTGVVAAL